MQHATQQIAQLEQQKLQLEKQILVAQKTQHQLAGAAPGTPGSGKSIPALMSQRIAMPGVDQEHMNTPPPSQTHDAHPHPAAHPAAHPQAPGNNIYANYQQQQPTQQPGNPFGDPRTANFFIPDMSKPPPGFPAPPLQSPQQQQQQQQPPPAQYAPVGAEPPVDLGVLNAAIQAVMHLQHQQHQQQQRHPDEQQQLQQQVQQQQQQQQPSAAYGVDSGVDLGALNAAIHVVLQQRPGADQEESSQQQQHNVEDRLDATADSGSSSMPAQEPQVPTAPYYDLPAGLMVPLIRLEDYNYKPLDPSDIRLPAPAPQSERLTNALNAFYAAPSHDRPRDK